MITRRELHQLFDLNFETGELIWKKPPVNLVGKLKSKVPLLVPRILRGS
jgi:hypothetical protein